jgi:hypothetical protein
VFTVNACPRLQPGQIFFWRSYFVLGKFDDVLQRSAKLVEATDYGRLELTQEQSPRRVCTEQVVESKHGCQLQETSNGQAGPHLLYAWPVRHSRSILQTGRWIPVSSTIRQAEDEMVLVYRNGNL